MAIRIYPIRTGSVRIRSAQVVRKAMGPISVMGDSPWSDWLPIYAWLIDHSEGPILVDTGETCRACARGYFPRWHPYYRFAVEFDIQQEQEVGPALLGVGIRPLDIRTVIMTHLHTDHAGGLHHFPKSTIWVSAREWRDARGVGGRIRGYVPNRWPKWFAPKLITFSGSTLECFSGAVAVTASEDVLVVSTPGHTPGHMSVLIRTDGTSYFLAGDASYTEKTLLARIPDGVTLFPKMAVKTLTNILAYAQKERTVYLPSHDPEAEQRLREDRALLVPRDGLQGVVGLREIL
ncbi:MAG: N-acyl homoserine lactonase family protein [Acidiferrobacter sp.]